jgi:hypothetical protein
MSQHDDTERNHGRGEQQRVPPRSAIRLTEQQLRARRSRSIAIALALGAFVVVIFVVTMVKFGDNVLTRPM